MLNFYKKYLCADCQSENPSLPIGPPGEDGQNGIQGPAGTDGINGISIGFTISTIDPGVDCECGGTQIQLGPDTNGDGAPDSVTETINICTGCDGEDSSFGFSPIVFVYDDPTDNTKFDQTGGDKGLGLGIYDGWAICNGNNGTPDLRGKFPVFYDDTNIDYNTEGNTGGAESVTLTKSQIPKHKHIIGNVTDGATLSDPGNHTHTYTFTDITANIGNGGSSAVNATETPGTSTSSAGAHTHTGVTGDGTTDSLAGNSHENRPPYIVLIPLMKI